MALHRPGGRLLGGLDIAWLVGLAASALAYLVLARSLDRAAESAAETRSDRELGIS